MKPLLDTVSTSELGEILQVISDKCLDHTVKEQFQALSKPYFKNLLTRFPDNSEITLSVVYAQHFMSDHTTRMGYRLRLTAPDGESTHWILFVNDDDAIFEVCERDPNLPSSKAVVH